ncbi:MAG: hypothetical protein AMJ79_00415 [Phycisphaerae bacterium SM23_30]|nr:MAG: hypothetical protein AMJ79_00415 [Phycisphaerae bacterium SM23_30]
MLIYKTKSLVKKTCRRFGYNLVKLPSQTAVQPFPYVRQYRVRGVVFDFWIADETGLRWYEVDGMEDTQEARALLKLARPKDKVLEIGCHHGFYTMLLAQVVGSEGRVLALEAEAKNALIAQAQAVLNNLGATVMVMHRAGADKSGPLTITTSDGSNAHAVTNIESGGMNVEAVTGDELAETYGPFNLLKIDVEGFEGQVLAGCKEILSTRPKIALELHLAQIEHYGTKVEDVFKLINFADYEGWMIVPPHFDQLVVFDPHNLPRAPGLNLFLKPRHP